MVGLAWNEKAPAARYYFLAILCLAVPLVSSFHAICFFLDGILFPRLWAVKVEAPVFMVGHARSGTTLTHRLMSRDAGRFSSFLLYECYFPSLLQKKVIRLGIALDRRLLGGRLARRVRAWEERRYGAHRHMHEMGLDWPEKRRRRYNAFYRECVRRQLYLNGPDKVHLAKNPLWAGRVASLLESFPDARFVVNVRDPRETIPSLLKLVQSGWKKMDWEESRQRNCLRILAEQSWHSYRHPLQCLEENPETPGAVVDYRDLVSDPATTIEGVYRALGLPISDAFRKLLAGEGKRERGRRTEHTYSLAEFGLEGDVIRDQLGDLFEHFQWDAEGGTPTEAAPGEAP